MKPCEACGKSFSLIKQDKHRTPRFCSHRCYADSIRGKPNNRVVSPEQREHARQMGLSNRGKFWSGMGDMVGYQGVHDWMKRRAGKPIVCTHCGKFGRGIEWANISGKYQRDTSDWMGLCRRCHVRYDHKFPKRPELIFDKNGYGRRLQTT